MIYMKERYGILLFHGSPEKLVKFKPGVLFLTDEKFDAIEFAKGVHIFGQYGRLSYLYTINAKEGKIFDADDIILAFIMEDEHEWIPDDYLEDIDSYIKDILAPKLRKMGYRYFTFYHPSSESSGDINVYVSLYPDKDLEIKDRIKVA